MKKSFGIILGGGVSLEVSCTEFLPSQNQPRFQQSGTGALNHGHSAQSSNLEPTRYNQK